MLPAPGARSSEAAAWLGRLWMEVRTLLADADDRVLGQVNIGTADANEWPWTHTNHHEERVNLTLELRDDRLELNMVGWKEAQAEALKNWLQSVAGEDAINSLANHEVVAYKRTAYKKTPASRPYWQREKRAELGACPAAEFNAGWISRQVVPLGSKKDEKAAFHVRHGWSRAEADALGERLPEELAIEVRRLLPFLRQIWCTEQRSS